MIGTVYNRNIFDRLGDALRAFKAQTQPGAFYPPPNAMNAGWISWQGWPAFEKQNPSNQNARDEANAKTAIVNPFVYRNVQAIAQECSVATLVMKELTAEGDEDIEQHPLELLWEKPNPFMGRSYLMQTWTAMLLLSGEAYIYCAPAGSSIAELWPVPSWWMMPRPHPKKFIDGYLFKSPGMEEGILIDPRYIIYSHLPNPFDVRRGLSPLAALMVEILGDNAMARWNSNFFSKENAAPTGLISVPKDTLDSDMTRIRQEIRDFFGGEGKQRVAIARAGDLAWEAFDRSQKDMEFLAGRQFNGKLIDTVFQIPEGYWAKDATRANSEGAKATMIENAVWPKLVMLAEDLNTQLIPQWFGEGLRAEFSDIRPRNRALELQEFTAWQAALTINELRKLIDQEPLEDVRGEMLFVELTKGAAIPATPASDETEEAIAAQQEELAGAMAELEGGEEEPIDAETPPMEEGGTVPEEAPMKADMRKWERKAIKSLKEKGQADVKFASASISEETQGVIHAALKEAQSIDDVRAAFAQTELGKSLWSLRSQSIKNGQVLLSDEEIEEEIKARRGGSEDVDALLDDVSADALSWAKKVLEG